MPGLFSKFYLNSMLIIADDDAWNIETCYENLKSFLCFKISIFFYV